MSIARFSNLIGRCMTYIQGPPRWVPLCLLTMSVGNVGTLLFVKLSSIDLAFSFIFQSVSAFLVESTLYHLLSLFSIPWIPCCFTCKYQEYASFRLLTSLWLVFLFPFLLCSFWLILLILVQCGSGRSVAPIKAGFVARVGRRNTGT